MLSLSDTLSFYKNPEVQQELVEEAMHKEVAIKFGERGFGKRPDVLQYKNDVLELVKQGATSFHASEEIWNNPLFLMPGMKKSELDENRKGWDLLLDIDCNHWHYSAYAADLLVKALKKYGIKSTGVKFSGNHGFHLIVPFEAFPKKINEQDTHSLFPDAPKRIAFFLREVIREPLSKIILEKYGIEKVSEDFEKKFDELVKDNKFDPFQILDIDTILLSSRHMYRMCYSFNEKSGLLSIPVDPDKVMEFKLEDAKPKNVISNVGKIRFLHREKVKLGEASRLIREAYDHKVKEGTEEERKNVFGKKYDKYEGSTEQEQIPVEFFPPCIQKIMLGLEDGKKRAMFILINFLSSVGWDPNQIDEFLADWNKKNPDPLREVTITGRMRYHKQAKKSVLPPNCNNKAYYIDFHVCMPDALCRSVKNPASYAKRKWKVHKQNNAPKKKRVMTEEQKAKMRETRRKRKEFREMMKKKLEKKDDQKDQKI